MLKSQRTRCVLAAALAVSIGACSGTGLHPESPNLKPTLSPAPLPADGFTVSRASEYSGQPGPTDGNIAAILLAAGNTDISYARLASTRAESSPVKEFARRMLTDNTSVNRLIDELLSTSGLVLEDNAASLGFRDESAATRDILRTLEGNAFDTTYIASEVSYHAKLLRSIDRDLQPLAANPQLRALIADVRPAVAAHLARAEEIRSALTSSK